MDSKPADVVTNVTKHVAKGVRGATFGLAKSVLGALCFLRALEVDDALKLIGVQRRRSFLLPVGLFAGGALVGAGLGVLLAPTSGKKLRARLRRQARALGTEAKAAALEAAERVEGVAEQVEDEIDDAVERAGDVLAENGISRRGAMKARSKSADRFTS